MTTAAAVTTALVVDVDGVVSPIHGHPAWPDETTAGVSFGPVLVSPTLCSHLDRLAARPGVQAWWLTSWDGEMRHHMDPFPGRDWPVVARPETGYADAKAWAGDRWERCGWWKWWALHRWLARQREITRLIWIDDDLNLTRLLGYDLDIATELANHQRVDVTLIAPASDTGLTAEHITQIEQILNTGQTP